jgi:glycosidase
MNASFKTIDWAAGSVIYEVNIRQYTPEGTFNAFAKHLPRLKEMGVSLIWLMPITPISQVGKKGSLGSYYACSSYTKINPEFGNEQDFKSLVDQVHGLGMKIIIDWVANHTGRHHEWMDTHPEWFSQDANGNFTERNGWDDVVDLNYHNEPMRAALIGAMQYWVKTFNLDGFRCDMAHLVPLDFWIAARKSFATIKELYWLAECEVIDYHEVFDTTYAWHWMHVSEKLSKGEAGMHDLYNVLHDYAQYPKGALKLFYTSNHDENSWNGTEYEKYGKAAKAWAVFTFTWKGIPLIYSGQELPLHKRLAFFDKDLIEWGNEFGKETTKETETEGPIGYPALHDFYKTLTTLRNSHPVIINGDTFNLPLDHSGAMAFLRMDENEIVLVVLNFSNEKVKLHCVHDRLQGKFTQIFSGMRYDFNKSISFELMPGDYFVYVPSK